MEVNFHLPGLRQNFPLNMLIVSLLETSPEYFREGVKIGSFFGEFPTSLWSGGRPSGFDQCDENYIRSVIRVVNGKGIPVRYTYTNMLITEEETKDPYCNFCMREADNGMNEVMIFSPILEEYIRKTYPSFKLNSSTCKQLRDIALVNEELKKDYYLVVLDYNFCGKFDELKKIDEPERCEILVNTLCTPNCPRRGAHYEHIARQQRVLVKNQQLPPDQQIPVERWYCEYGERSDFHKIQSFSTFIQPEEIWEKYVPMGFHHFKIEGRSANIFWMVEMYCHYLIKPEYQGQARITLLNNLALNRVITVNKPRPAKWNGGGSRRIRKEKLVKNLLKHAANYAILHNAMDMRVPA